ncbi:hypothetical protein [Micromonospora sp. NPDC050200]
MSNADLSTGLVTPYFGLDAVGRPLPVADGTSAPAAWFALAALNRTSTQ